MCIDLSNRREFSLAPIALAISPVHFCPHWLHGVPHVVVFRRTLARPLGFRRRRHTREAVVVLGGGRPVAQRVGLRRQGPVLVHAISPAAVTVTVSHSSRRSRGGPPVGNPVVLGGGTAAIPVVLLRPGSRGGVGGVGCALVIPSAVFRRCVSWGRQ